MRYAPRENAEVPIEKARIAIAVSSTIPFYDSCAKDIWPAKSIGASLVAGRACLYHSFTMWSRDYAPVRRQFLSVRTCHGQEKGRRETEAGYQE